MLFAKKWYKVIKQSWGWLVIWEIEKDHVAGSHAQGIVLDLQANDAAVYCLQALNDIREGGVSQ